MSHDNEELNNFKSKQRKKNVLNKRSAIMVSVAMGLNVLSPMMIEQRVAHAQEWTADGYTRYKDDKASSKLMDSIQWINFSDGTVTNAIDVGGRKGLKVGTTYTKEIIPGYTIKLTVKSLGPFDTSEHYRQRKGSVNNTVNKGSVIMAPQDSSWSRARNLGLIVDGDSTITASQNDGNVGVVFDVETQYAGKKVPANIIMTSGEDAGPKELEIYTTDGSPWKLVTELSKGTSEVLNATQSYKPLVKSVLGFSDEEYKYWGNIVRDGETRDDNYTIKDVDGTVYGDGIGTRVFGPVTTAKAQYFSLPVVLTEGVSELGVYIKTSGNQGAMIGVVLSDLGDAPDSFGDATHFVTNNSHPYLGTTKPDIDIYMAGETKEPWLADDNKNTGSNSDEGLEQLVGDKATVLENGKKIYEPYVESAPEYVLNILANGNGAKAYAYGWIDFNNNKEFEDSERSDLITVEDGQGTYKLHFNNPDILTPLGTSVDKLGARLRIAKDEKDIQKPTGVSYSGEVEDFNIDVIQPPRMVDHEHDDATVTDYIKEIDGYAGDVQKTKIDFEAFGTNKTDFTTKNEIVSVKIWDPNKNEEVTEFENEDGKYLINPDTGEITFTPKSGVPSLDTGDKVATPVEIRATDRNGQSSTWGSGENIHSIKVQPHIYGITQQVTQDYQGIEQNKTLEFKTAGASPQTITPDATNQAKFVGGDGATVDNDQIDAIDNDKKIGVYKLDKFTGKVTFVPNKDFVGSPNPVLVRLEKDSKVVTAKYQPVVKKIIVIPESTSSENQQGMNQMGTPTFKNHKEDATSNADDTPITIDENNTVSLVGVDNNPIDADTIDATLNGEKVGEYKLNKTNGQVTFVPNSDFIGAPEPAKVQMTNHNGTTAIAQYQPRVKSIPTEISTEGYINENQEAELKFNDIAIKKSDMSTFAFVDVTNSVAHPDGTIDDMQIPAKKNGVEVGKYVLIKDGDKPKVKFVPNSGFMGRPEQVELHITVNGTSARQIYKPMVKPNDTTKSTDGYQGEMQETELDFNGLLAENISTLKFKDGDNTAMDAMKDGVKVGIYTLVKDANSAKVQFMPNPDFKDTAEPAILTIEKDDVVATEVYTPTVIPVTLTSENKETEGEQGEIQKATPTFKNSRDENLLPNGQNHVELLDNNGDVVPENTIDAILDTEIVGKYTIDKTTGEVTFTPNDDFGGSPMPAVVQMTDKNGTKVTATYQPTVRAKVTPDPDITTGGQGSPQTGTPEFKDNKGNKIQISEKNKPKLVDPMTDRPTDNTTVPAMKDGQQIGTYTINYSTGQVKFIPYPEFSGVPEPARVEVSVYGDKVRANYQPVVMPNKSQEADANTEDLPGKTQSTKINLGDTPVTAEDLKTLRLIDPITNEPMNATTMSALFVDKDGVTNKVGVYKVIKDENNPNNVRVEFSPNLDFEGQPIPLTIQMSVDGKIVTEIYAPYVKPVVAFAEDKKTIGKKGEPQSEKIIFMDENNNEIPVDSTKNPRLIDPITGEDTDSDTIPAMKDGVPIGVYKIDKNTGIVTFEPNTDFIGKPDPVKVQISMYGRNFLGEYQPEVKQQEQLPTDVTGEGGSSSTHGDSVSTDSTSPNKYNTTDTEKIDAKLETKKEIKTEEVRKVENPKVEPVKTIETQMPKEAIESKGVEKTLVVETPKMEQKNNENAGVTSFNVPKSGHINMPPKEEVESVKISKQPEHGSVTVDKDGNWNYTPSIGFVGTVSFTVQVKDYNGNIMEEIVTLEILPPPLGFAKDVEDSNNTSNTLPDTGDVSRDYSFLGMLSIAIASLFRRKNKNK